MATSQLSSQNIPESRLHAESAAASDDAVLNKKWDRAADRVAKRLGMSEATLRRADQVVKNAVQPFLIRFMNLRITNSHLTLMAESSLVMTRPYTLIDILASRNGIANGGP